jgi:hypothetical protein
LEILAVLALLSLLLPACRAKPKLKPRSPASTPLTRDSATEQLVAYLRGWEGPDQGVEAVERVAELGTPQAREALLEFVREMSGPMDWEMAAAAFGMFDKSITRELFEIYSERKGDNGAMARMICAQTIADFAKYDDWSLSASIDIYLDNLDADHDIATITADALDARPDATRRILNERIERTDDEKERTRLQELLEALAKPAIPASGDGTARE